MKHTPPPLLFPERSGILSARCMEKPVGLMIKSGTSRDIQVSVRQIRAISDLMLERNPRSQLTLFIVKGLDVRP